MDIRAAEISKVIIGSKRIDASIRTRLNSLSQAMKA